MLENLQQYQEEVNNFNGGTASEVEEFRIKFLGKKGIINDLFFAFKALPGDQKKAYGQPLNILKKAAEDKVESFQNTQGIDENNASFEDLTRPGYAKSKGSIHPISLVRNEICDIFSKFGFSIAFGPEVEDDWHNFTALNLPKYHPARDMQDTFFLDVSPERLLRTHTSSVQIRHMENAKPPLRFLAPGRVFRNEAISARSHCLFHQVEGLYVDENVSFADLKQTIQYFTESLFGKSKIRMRPSYFPFTEPSAEVDVYWGLETETDYRITKGTGWLEIMGCGMVDPSVLENVGIDSDQYSGFAFGMGIERIAMLLYQIGDIRMFFENDIRFLQQFGAQY